MDFQRLVRRRRMVRNFDRRPVPPEILECILENARRAPSAGFAQGWAFLVLQGADQTEAYWRAMLPEPKRARFPWPGLLNAPVLIVPLAHARSYLERYAEADKRAARPTQEDWPTPYWHVDTAFAALLILLGATDAGLGALFFAVADIPTFRTVFGVPDEYHPIGAIALGYPLPERRSGSLRRGRKPANMVIHHGRW